MVSRIYATEQLESWRDAEVSKGWSFDRNRNSLLCSDDTTWFFSLNQYFHFFMELSYFVGSREYMIDLCEVFTYEEGRSPVRTATNNWQFPIFNVLPFVFLVSSLTHTDL